MYIHELNEWPRVGWDTARIAAPLASVRHRQGRLIGRMESLGFGLRQEAVLRTLTADVLKSSEIEGEKLEADLVRSSIARAMRPLPSPNGWIVTNHSWLKAALSTSSISAGLLNQSRNAVISRSSRAAAGATK